MISVKIKRIDKDLPLPVYQTPGSVAVDLYARVATVVEPHQVVLIPSNVVLATPPGYFFLVASRSSTPMKKGLILANGIGVVDQDFCGEEDEIQLQFINLTSKAIKVERGERLAQGLMVKIEKVGWNEVGEMNEPTRGGFGSTSI